MRRTVLFRLPRPPLAFAAFATFTSWCAVLALAIAATGVASAEEPHGEARKEVLVRARPAGGFVSQASLDDAPREITDTASLLQPMPGVHVRRLGADDSFATLSVRGTSSSQVAVFLAGVPLTGGADPTLDLATLPLWPGARARVYRSFAPAALGRGSLGGTLVLDPPSPRTLRSSGRTEVWGAVGSFGARRLRVGDVRAAGDVRIASALSASRSDNDFRYLDPSATQFAGHDVLRTRDNAGHAQASGLVSLAMPARIAGLRDGALSVTALAQGRRQELPGTIHFQTPFQRLDSSRLVSALELSVPSGPGAASVRAWGRRDELSIHDVRTAASAGYAGPTSTDDAILATGGSVGWRGAPLERLLLDGRVNAGAERFAPGSWLGATAPPGARRTNAGVGIDATARVLERTTLTASGRGDVWFDSSGDGTSKSTARPTGHVGIEQGAGPITLASHLGALTRPASFTERYGNRGGFLGDPSLRPESAVTVDAGAQARIRKGPLRLYAELAGFSTWASDLITYVPAGAYGQARATNIGEARILGLEGHLRATAFGFDLRLTHTALATRNRSSDVCCPAPPLPGRPEHDFVGNLAWERGPVLLRYGLDVMTGMRADVAGNITVPPRALHSAGVQLAVPGARGLSVSLSVWNLFDLRAVGYPSATGGTDRYPIGDLYDFPLPGRRVLAAARWVHD